VWYELIFEVPFHFVAYLCRMLTHAECNVRFSTAVLFASDIESLVSVSGILLRALHVNKLPSIGSIECTHVMSVL